MALSKLLKDVKPESKEVAKADMESNSGGGFITKGGIYKCTIQKAFMTPTKKGGVQFDLHLGGDNMINTRLYIVSNHKEKGMITTCVFNGKTVTLPDYKMFKQLYYVATREALALEEMTIKEETVKYKDFGKNVEVEAETVEGLIGKTIQIAFRAEEEYNYEDGEIDKTDIKRDKNGNPRYKLSIFGVYTEDGYSPIEAIKEEEPKSLLSAKEFLASDRGIKKVKLEAKEIEVEESEDILDF